MAWKLKTKIHTFTVLFSLAISLLFGFSVFYFSSKLFTQNFLDDKLNMVSTVAHSIDGSVHQRFRNNAAKADPEYKRYLAYLNSIRESKNEDLTYLFTLAVGPGTNQLYYVIDATILKYDTLWLESDQFALQISMDSNGINNIRYNQETYSNSFPINLPSGNHRIGWKSDSQGQIVLLDKVPLVRINKGPNPGAVTAEGPVDSLHRIREIKFLTGTNSFLFLVSFTGKGESESDPGAPFVDKPENIRKILRIIKNGKDYIEPGIKEDIYGSSISGYGIIHDKNGRTAGIVEADIYLEDINQFQSSILWISILVTLISFLVSFLFSFHISSVMLNPIHILAQGITRIMKGDYQTRIRLHRRDELGDLANGLNHMAESISQSITDIIKSKENLQESISTLTATLEATEDGILVLGYDGEITHFNNKFREIWKCRGSENPRDILSSISNRIKIPEHFAQFLKYSVFLSEEVTSHCIETRDGYTIECYSRAQVLDNKVTGRVWSFRDISQRRKNEEDIRLVAKVFENSSEGIIITNHLMNILQINDAFMKITGYTADILGKRPTNFSTAWNEEEIYESLWNSLLKKGIWQSEVWDKRADGTPCALFETLIAIKNRQGLVTNYIWIFQDITEKKKSEEQIEILAYYDPLTNLPNRALLQDRLRQSIAYAQRHNSCLALLFLDLDNFKKINDTLGHHIGDALLKQVAGRIQLCLRPYDTCSRLGGDEFILVLTEIRTEADVAVIAKRVMEALSEPYTLSGQEVFTGCSIGISMYPKDGEVMSDLMKNADSAMYIAKDNGKNGFYFYTEKINSGSYQRLWLDSSLHTAIQKNELMLYYQPQLDLQSGKVYSVEALLRWKHPELGFIPPSDFIPVCEESNQILRIGEWVIQQACERIKVWQNNGLPRITIAINVSTIQLKQHDFASIVRRLLEESAVDPSLFELEITESLFMTNIEENIRKLRELQALGIRVSLDDFGTGYSSMAYLQKLPIQKLKIDRAFIQNIPDKADDTAITKSIIALAHSLNLKVIAEGVEKKEQLDFLKEHSCEEIQGYYISPPVSGDDVVQFF